MRKKLLVFAILLLCLALAGCKSEPRQNGSLPFQSPTIYPSTSVPDETSENIPLSDIPLTSVSMPLVNKQMLSEDGVALLTYTYQDISILHQDAEVASKVELDFLNQTDCGAMVESMTKQADAAYGKNPANWIPYSISLYASPTRIDSSVLSIFCRESAYDGNTAAESSFAANYSLVDGARLTFRDIMAPEFDSKEFLSVVTETVRESGLEGSLFDDYKEILADYFGANYASFQNWYLTSNGLTLFFSPYDIAPNAMGTVKIEIPYGKLLGILKDDFFPPEAYQTGGTIEVSAFDQSDLTKFTAFSEVICSSDGTQLLLTTQGALTDVRIEAGSIDPATGEFTAYAAVFAAEGLSAGKAIMLQADLAVSPALRLTYFSCGEFQTAFFANDL